MKSDAVEVFEFWRSEMDHPKAKLGARRTGKIKKALKMYSVDELKKAILGCKNTPWNMGKNPSRRKYDSIELIVRNEEKIEAYIDNCPEPDENNNNDEGVYDLRDV